MHLLFNNGARLGVLKNHFHPRQQSVKDLLFSFLSIFIVSSFPALNYKTPSLKKVVQIGRKP